MSLTVDRKRPAAVTPSREPVEPLAGESRPGASTEWKAKGRPAPAALSFDVRLNEPQKDRLSFMQSTTRQHASELDAASAELALASRAVLELDAKSASPSPELTAARARLAAAQTGFATKKEQCERSRAALHDWALKEVAPKDGELVRLSQRVAAARGATAYANLSAQMLRDLAEGGSLKPTDRNTSQRLEELHRVLTSTSAVAQELGYPEFRPNETSHLHEQLKALAQFGRDEEQGLSLRLNQRFTALVDHLATLGL